MHIEVIPFDLAVSIIRASKTTEEARNRLIEVFEIDEIQAKAILDMTLSRLVGLGKDKIEKEASTLRSF